MKTHKNHLRLLILLLLVLLACAGYMTVGVHFENQKLFAYAMRIRTPKLIAMLITAFAIGSASIVFQSIINNTIVTPCLLGMDQLYSLIHTAVFFVAGSGSFLAVNANAAFAVDLAIMGAVATVIYNDLLGYADLILNGNPEEYLNGNPEEYLKNVTGSHGLED